MRQHRRWLVPLPLKLSAASIADISEFNAAEQTTKRREFECRGKYHEVERDDNSRMIIWEYREVLN